MGTYLNRSRGKGRETGASVANLTSPIVRGTKEVITFVISGTPTGGYVLIGQTGYGLTARVDLETLIDGTASVAQNYLKNILKRFNGITDITVVRSGSTPNFTFTCTVERYASIANFTRASNQLTGGTAPDVTVTVTTAGVDADGLGYANGAMITDLTNGDQYVNLGTADLPELWRVNSRVINANKTANYTLLLRDSGGVFTNAGASGTVVFSLPVATTGLEYTFVVRAAQHLRLDPNGSETINKADGTVGGAGKYLGINTVNSTCRVRCVTAGHWTLMNALGAWDLEP